MSLKKLSSILFVLVLGTFMSCSQNDHTRSGAKDIVVFTITGQVGTTTITDIDATHGTILVTVPNRTVVTALRPTVEVSALASVSPASGVPQDFTNRVVYTVKSENSTTKEYTVTLNTIDQLLRKRMEGTWGSSCIDNGIYLKVTQLNIVYSSGYNTLLEEMEDYASDSSCSTGNLRSKFRFSYVGITTGYVPGETDTSDTISTSHGEASKINLIMEYAKFTPHNVDGVSMAALCGYAGAVIGQEYDVTGCASLGQLLEAGDTGYTIFILPTDTVMLFENNISVTSNTRPVDFTPLTLTFTKQ